MRFSFPLLPAEFEIPDEWWTRAGMTGFAPSGPAYSSTADAMLRPLLEVEPLAKLHGGQRFLSKVMTRYWVQFAKQGDPNGPQTPNWASYSVDADEFQKLAPFAVAPESMFASAHHCEFWAALFPQ